MVNLFGALSGCQLQPNSGLHFQVVNGSPIQGCLIRLSILALFRAAFLGCHGSPIPGNGIMFEMVVQFRAVLSGSHNSPIQGCNFRLSMIALCRQL